MIKGIPDKSEWPKTADGTTDWEALFDNKEKGLIAFVLGNETPVQLKQQTDAIIRAIFNRKRDQALLDKLTAFLNKLIPNDAAQERFPSLQERVIELLEKIKNNRIDRARAFSEKKGKSKKSKENTNRRANPVIGFFRRRSDALGIAISLLKIKPKKSQKNKNKGLKDLASSIAATAATNEDAFFQQDAYVDDSDGGNTEWEDDDSLTMKEGSYAQVIYEEDEIKEDERLESWDDY
ncbi:MAG: hypothetical protein ISR45_02070 [Rhodospirillales bacterium]|nr:hypothetical protein [Rhodospirillales bacterium]